MKKISLILTAIILAFFTSCKEKIDMNLNEQGFSRLVVESIITDEVKTQTIHLTQTSNYSDPQPPVPASGAIVSVSDGTSTYSFTESTPGIYTSTSPFGCLQGKQYNLSILYKEEEYEASSTVYEGLQIDSLYAEESPRPEYIYIFGDFTDSQVPNQYFLLKYEKNGVLYDSLLNWSVASDELFNGVVMQEVILGFIEGKPGDLIKLSTYSIDKGFYDFVNNAISSLSQPIPFFGSNPGNIKGNITNGAMGYFQASVVNSKACVVK